MSVSFILIVLGALLIVEGIPYFAFPGKVKEWSLLLQEIPAGDLRIMGLLAMVSGLLILFFTRAVF